MDFEDKLHDKCGVFGIYNHNRDVARITYYALYGLQHRGQESAGIAVNNGKKFKIRRGMGLVRDVFKSEKHIERLGKGTIAVGHNRYSTTGSSELCNAQPFLIKKEEKQLVIAHNGNLINSLDLKTKIKNTTLSSTTDTEIVGALLIENSEKDWAKKFQEILPILKGAYSFVIATKDQIFGARDPYGVRPLVLGKLNSGWVLSSEDCIFPGIGAKKIREIEPGEAIVIDNNGPRTIYKQKIEKKASCIFEYVYLARPDSNFNGVSIGKAREKCGEILFEEAPVKADMVMSIPNSGTTAAIGFSNKSKTPFGEGVIQNRYIGRTFIQPDQNLRDLGVKIKFGPMIENLKGKKLVVVDDSIVRGSTFKDFVKLLRNYGAKEVHVRIACPPIISPCFYGVDTPTKKELIANHFLENGGVNVKKIEKFIGADSLHYLSLNGLLKACEVKEMKKNFNPQDASFCTACLTGKYKIKLTGGEGKFNLEKSTKKLAVLISNAGTGTNLQAIIDGIENKKIKAKIAVVISDTKDSLGLKRAKKHNLQTEIVEKKEKLLEVLRKYDVDYICLAGWKQYINAGILNIYKNNILNVHPGLVPESINGDIKNPDGTIGLWNQKMLTNKALENYLKNKMTYAGSSIHFLTKEVDFGPVLGRCFEKIKKKDTVESLYKRLKEKENNMYAEVLATLCK